MEFLVLITGILAGGTIAYFITRSYLLGRFVITREQKEVLEKKISVLEIECRVSEGKLESLREEYAGLKENLESEREKSLQLSKSLATREAEYTALLEKLSNQKKEIEEIHEKLNIQFKNLANEILEDKSKKFTDQNKIQISEILNPLKEKISDFEKKVEQTHKENIEKNASLKEQILSLKDLNQKITRDAENLTRALKGDTKSQGIWGEFILEKILEKSGLVKDKEYVTQESHFAEDGRRVQPDVIVKLPENKNLIIDSKVSLVAYERYINADDEDGKKEFIREHVQSVRNHIKSLGEKYYQSLKVSGLDFVLLFMPVEPAFGIAIQQDERLFLDAYEKNIVIVSPSTLIATLRTIASIWRQEYQNRNAMEIAKQGGDLYDKFVNFTKDLIQLGEKLDSAKKTHEDAMKKLTSGTGNLVGRADKLRKLGAKVKSHLDPNLLEEEDNEPAA